MSAGEPPAADPERPAANLHAREQSLLSAFASIAASLDVRATLERIVAAAAVLAEARYVALGVLDESGDSLAEFITHGISAEQAAAIGPPPTGHGVLGLLLSDARPVRVHDISQHPSSYGFPPNHPPMTTFLGVPVRVGDRVFGNLYLTEKLDGGDFTDADEEAVVALAGAAGVAVENARLYETVRRRQRWLEATAEIQQAFLRRVDLATALQLLTVRSREVLEADVSLVVLERDDGALEVRAADGAPHVAGTELPRQGAIVDTLDRGATVRLAEGVRIRGLEFVQSAFLVPFTGPAGAGGALLVGTRSAQAARWLVDDDVTALRGFAAQVAIAMDRAQAQEDRASLAVLADRDRIALDLHDVVIQRLFATGLTLQGAVRRAVDPEVVQRLNDAVGQLDATIRDIRGTIFDLSHPDEDVSLRGQIRQVATNARPTLGLRPELTLEGPLDSEVPDPLRPDLVAVLIESLSNAARHSAATHVWVRVALEGEDGDRRLVAEVRDDGRGFDAADHESGLRNMRQRAKAHGGTCTVDSSPGVGTTVRWCVSV